MKTNLVKILALLAMTVSLGACTGQKQQGGGSSEASSGSSEQQSSESETSSDTSESSSQEEIEDLGIVSLGEVLDLNNDNQWNYLGKKMTVEHLVMQGKYGNTIIGGAALGQYISDLRGLEVQCAELPTFDGSGWGADLTVTGILDDVNGRAVFKEAEVTVNSERVYNEARTEYTGGLPVYMWPENLMNRGNFDYYMGRNMSGIFLAGTFQLAQKPEVITADEASVFYAAFPGEYLDVEDEDNVSILTFQVPAGLSDAAVTAFNNYFAEKKVGDFFTFEGCGQYDAIENIGYGFVVDSWAAQSFVDPEEEPVLYSTWESVTDKVNAYYAEELPAIGDDDLIFNYTFEVYQGKKLSELFTDLTYVYITDKEKCLFSEFSFYAAPSDMDDAFDSVVAKAKTAGYEAAVEETGAAILTLKDGSDNVVSQIDVFQEDAYLDIYYFGIPFATEFDNFADVKALYEGRVSKRLGAGYATALVDATPAATSYELDLSKEEAWAKYFANFGAFYQYSLVFSYENLGENTLLGIVNAYTAALKAAGFVDKTFSLFGTDGLFNPTSNEFVAGFQAGEDGKSFIVSFFTLSSATAANYIKDPAIVYDTMAEAVGAYLSATQAFAESLGITGTLQTALPTALDGEEFELDISSLDAYADDYTNYGVFYGEVIITATLPENADAAAVLAAYKQALVDAGFAGGKTLQMWADYDYVGGYFNATTNEYVLVSVEDGALVIDIVFMNSALANMSGAGIADDAPAA